MTTVKEKLGKKVREKLRPIVMLKNVKDIYLYNKNNFVKIFLEEENKFY